METKVNYAIVGLFVLLLAAAGVAGVLWLSAGAGYGKSYDTYVSYMSESVSGLNLNAPVKYRGVDVGQVRQIAIDPENSERVRLVLAIERGTPIKTDTVAVLRSQGLTGLAYVELSGGSRNAPPLRAKAGEPYPVIASGPSLLARLDSAVTHLLTNLNLAAENVNSLLDADNRQAFKQTLADVRTVMQQLADQRRAIDAGIASGARAMDNLAGASAQLTEVLQRIGRSADAVGKMAAETAQTNAAARRTLDAIDGDARRLAQQSLPELENTLAEARALAVTMRQIAQQVERNPSVLLRGTAPPPPGPGEK